MRSNIPDLRERPARQRERQPDPIGVQMARMPVDRLVEEIDLLLDRGRGYLRIARSSIERHLPAGPSTTAKGER